MVLFKDRDDAGRRLAQRIRESGLCLENPIVLAIPRGGVPIGYCLAQRLRCVLEVLVLRKLPLPDNPEAGFGAVTLDKTVVLNEKLLQILLLSKNHLDRIIADVYREVLRRDRAYRGQRVFPALKNCSIILTDDGLASGYTMLSAVEFTRKHQAKNIIVASPVAHRQAYQLVKRKADGVITLYISQAAYFAVASFYQEFPGMDDEEVLTYLKRNAEQMRPHWTVDQ